MSPPEKQGDDANINTFRTILLEALRDCWTSADILGEDEPILDRKSRYYSLFAQLFQLHRKFADSHDLTHAPCSVSTTKNLLAQLQSFFAPGQDPPAYSAGNGAELIFPGLTALHEMMDSDRHKRETKLKFLKSSVNLTSNKQLIELDDFLKNANSILSDQKSLETELQIPKRPRQRPPEHILPAAESLFRVLESKRRCACDPAHRYIVQLCLETHLARLKDCDFDLYLGLDCSWQEASVQTIALTSSSEWPKNHQLHP